MSLEDAHNRSEATETVRMRALAHPLRLRMLSLLTGAPFSAAELARELAVTHALASYHLRRLVTAGLVNLVETRTTNHATERRYRYLPADVPHRGPGTNLGLMFDGMAAEGRRRVLDYAAGTATTFVDAELWLEPAVWERARTALAQTGRALHAAARPPHEPGTVRTHLAIQALTLTDPTP